MKIIIVTVTGDQITTLSSTIICSAFVIAVIRAITQGSAEESPRARAQTRLRAASKHSAKVNRLRTRRGSEETGRRGSRPCPEGGTGGYDLCPLMSIGSSTSLTSPQRKEERYGLLLQEIGKWLAVGAGLVAGLRGGSGRLGASLVYQR